MSATPKASWPWVKTMLHSVCDQPDTASVHAQYDRLVDAVAGKLPKVADHLETARPDVLAFRIPEGALAPDLVQQPDRYLELSRQPGLSPAASRRGQCRRRDARGLIPAVSPLWIVT
jgi:hypothetical protein